MSPLRPVNCVFRFNTEERRLTKATADNKEDRKTQQNETNTEVNHHTPMASCQLVLCNLCFVCVIWCKHLQNKLTSLEHTSQKSREPHCAIVEIQTTWCYCNVTTWCLPQRNHVVLPQRNHVVLPQRNHVVLPQRNHMVLPQRNHVVLPQRNHVVLPAT